MVNKNMQVFRIYVINWPDTCSTNHGEFDVFFFVIDQRCSSW